MSFLTAKNISKRFGGLTALDQVSLDVEEGEIRGLIGPNGAGKSTMFKVISGAYFPSAGSILFQGEDVTRQPWHKRAEEGIIRTFQETTLFEEFTAWENVLVGCHMQAHTGLFRAIFGRDKAREREAERKVQEVMEFMGVADRKDEMASDLPLGFQRALGMAIALASGPRVLLLDEPFAGMNPEETNTMMDLVRKVRDSGITVILVEHDMKAIMGLCDRISVLNFGQLLAEGAPEEIRNNKDVIEAYLGAA
ncbi:ABC transporter ATP-binding protein [Thiohalorhabdus methylotrophus]|uniref:ABC transporter ATP-binding protein n=1 Tax=Thiohalorhabdus methylotrophus TaxID=3242694 RepID=A0ABV4TV72_9GAMM